MTRRPLLVLGIVFLLGGALRNLHLDDVLYRTPDEKTYLGFAARVAGRGLAEMPRVVADYLGNEEIQNYPSPVRVGYTWPLAGTVWLSGSTGYGPGVTISYASSILCLILVGYAGMRFFGPVAAVTAMFLLATSCAELTMARRAWQDSLCGLAGLLTIWLALEIMRSPEKWRFCAAFHVIGVWSMLMKQTGAIVYLLAGLCVLYVLRDRRQSLKFAGTGLAALAAGAWILVASCGGIGNTLQALRLSIVFAPNALRYATACCEGPWWQAVWAMLLLDPATTLLALTGICLAFRSRAAAVCAAVTVPFVAFISVSHYVQNLRYNSMIEGAMVLLAGYGVSRLLAGRQRNWQIAAAVVLLASGMLQYRQFQKIGLPEEIQDLGAVQIRQTLGF